MTLLQIAAGLSYKDNVTSFVPSAKEISVVKKVDISNATDLKRIQELRAIKKHDNLVEILIIRLEKALNMDTTHIYS